MPRVRVLFLIQIELTNVHSYGKSLRICLRKPYSVSTLQAGPTP